ncbi:MAG: 1,6-anhydro-N-acetylmuramyl-L-alanine amidase AmpD, partial [Mariprofundaceae bacterium]|nr:1,6-anhydro-N-acetylmuramyl-L-alanine amidase AmpD [Mariprofundaceae bacterium]
MPAKQTIRFIASPHHDARPPHTDIDLIVLHAISLPAGEFVMQHVEALFTGRLDTSAHPTFESLDGLRVAAHFVVDRAGSITQFVPIETRAWHAGKSVWQGRDGCNDYAI